MAVRTTAMQTCDRCLKPFNEKSLKAGDAVPVFKQKGLIVTEITGSSKEKEVKETVLFAFDDLCPDCDKAVTNLIDKININGSGAKKKRSGVAKKRGGKKKTEETTEEKTPGYSEESEGSNSEGAEETAEVKTEEASDQKATEPEPDSKPAEEEKDESASENSESEPEPEAESKGGNGLDDNPNYVRDPETGDVYDKNTGEVVKRGDESGDSNTEKHPF